MNQSPEPRESSSTLNAFFAAIQFLLISPALIKRPFTPVELGAAVGFFPLVGLILGAILAGVQALLALVFPPLVCSALLLTLWVILTGALHLDGFLDACDGLLGGHDPEQRLKIMRDERVGAYALAGGTLLLLIKFSALSSLSSGLMPALLLAPTLGRWSIAMALVMYPYARPQGLGRDMKVNASLKQALLATITTGIVTVGVAIWSGPLPIILALSTAVLTGWLVTRFVLGRLPGLTGDIYGALNELVELSVLVVLSLG